MRFHAPPTTRLAPKPAAPATAPAAALASTVHTEKNPSSASAKIEIPAMNRPSAPARRVSAPAGPWRSKKVGLYSLDSATTRPHALPRSRATAEAGGDVQGL